MTSRNTANSRPDTMIAPIGMASDSAKRRNCKFAPDLAGIAAVSAV